MRGYGTAKNDAHAWLTRSGSRSTVPSSRGHFRGLAPEIAEELEHSERRQILQEQYERGIQELRALKEMRKQGMGIRLQDYTATRDTIVAQNTYLAEELHKLKGQRRVACCPSLSLIFQRIAKEKLPKNTYDMILEAAKKKTDEIIAENSQRESEKEHDSDT